MRRLYGYLAGRCDVWWDLEKMPSRSLSFLEEIRRAIDACERVIVVIGPVAVRSDYVRAEWLYGMAKDKPVIPLLRSGKNPRKPVAKDYGLLPAEMKNLHTLDFRTGRPFAKACEELDRVLREKVPTPGPFRTAVPDTPPHFQPRPAELSAIADAVLPDLKTPTLIDGPARVTFIHGMGGAGKSVMAAGFARLTETRRAFTDGVAWITYSETVGVRDALATAGSGFGDDISGYRDVPSAADSLRRKLQALRCLLVVDNATVIEQVTPFANALGPDCRLLVTTRDASLAAGRRAVPVGVLDDAAASLHLADWADVKPDQLPPEALEVARQCAGLPLATAVCGAMVSQGTPWSDLLTKLEQADLAFLKAHFDYPHPTVLQCLKVSLDLLDPAERERYSELRIFDVTQPVPESVVVRLWTREGRMSPEDARELIKTLALRALLRIETDSRRISLHDLQHDMLRGLYSGAQPVHARLVEVYREECGGAWTRLIDDGYVFSWLVFHMLASGLKEEALRLVSGSDAWFRFKRSDPTHQAGLLTDIELCLAASPDLLQIARLCAAGQLVRYGAAAYADGDVLCLARLGRVAEALFQTRLRGDPVKAVSGFLTLLENGFREAEQETEIRIRTLSEIGARASALARFASALSPGDRERAQTAARDALAMMTPFNPEGDRYDTNATAGALEALVSTGLAREVLAFIDNVASEDWRAYLLQSVALRAIKSAPPALRSVVARLKRCPAGAAKALTLAYVATALADINKLQAKRMLKAADEAARSIEDPAALVRTTARRAAALALLGGSHALRLFEKAEAQIADPKVKNFDRSKLVLYLTEALLAARNLDGAKRVAESIQSQLDRGRFAERVVVELIRQNRLDEAAESARPIESMESRAAAFSNVAAAFASAGRRREAEEYLQLALDTRQTYDQQGHTLEALASMAVALYAVEPAITDRLLSQAIANVQSLPHDYDRSSSVLEVVRACCAAGRPVDAESLFSHIRNDVHRREAMEEVAFVRGRLEQPEIAIAWAEERLEGDSLHWTTARIYRNSKRWVEAIDSVDRIARDYSRAANLAEIAAAMALAGETDAKDVFVRAESVARTATDDWSTPEYIQTLALGAVASALVSCGWADEAWRVAESTERNRDGAIPRLEAAAALARAGDQRGSGFIADFWNMCLQNSHRDGMLMICSALAQAGLAKDTEAVAGKLLADPTLEAGERTTVCGYLAQAGLRAPALRNLQPDSLDRYLEELARIAAGWPDCADILRETVGVASWVRSDWKRVHATIMAR